jgi:uncharacterized protein (DUF1778 family)
MSSVKSDRMQIRIDKSNKKKIERAAQYVQKSVSEFVVGNALAAADKIIDEHGHTVLSARDWDLFCEAVLNPPKPNQTLRRAFKRYQGRQRK